MSLYRIANEDYLEHHGILGQKWGKRNGPPYPLTGGKYSKVELAKINNARRVFKNSIYSKKHFDKVLKAGKTTLSTVSFNADRTKKGLTDMFYAAHTVFDKAQYNMLFNSPIKTTITDNDGNKIKDRYMFKFRIDNKLSQDVKVASEDSAAKTFVNMYHNDRDFYNFITDKNRLRKYMPEKQYGYKGYEEAKNALNNIARNKGKHVSENDLRKVYRLFNYVIPYDGSQNNNDQRGAHDVAVQRNKFFNALKKDGYGALLDTNDSIYNKLHANSAVIVFDMDKVIEDKVVQTGIKDKIISGAIYANTKQFNL